MAETEVLPEGVVASNGAPETANAGGDAKGTVVEAFEDFYEDVYVVVDEELGSFFLALFDSLLVFMVPVAVVVLHHC